MGKGKKYSEEHLIKKLKEKVEELGRVPGTRELGKNQGMPSLSAYISCFGSYSNAVKRAGFKPNERAFRKKRAHIHVKERTKKELLLNNYRSMICNYLEEGAAYYTELRTELDINHGALIYHLKVLEDNGIIDRKKIGHKVYFALNGNDFDHLFI